jgi:Arc/MetJ family transcription regulator
MKPYLCQSHAKCKRVEGLSFGLGGRRLPYSHTADTYSHMKTTLNIDDTVMAELKREAARQGRTMSELVESALRMLLRSHRKQEKLAPLPTFHSGGALVDIADRDALYQAMEGR